MATDSDEGTAAAVTTWRAIARNEDHVTSVRAEALARILRTQDQPEPADSATLADLLEESPPEHALRILRVLDDC